MNNNINIHFLNEKMYMTTSIAKQPKSLQENSITDGLKIIKKKRFKPGQTLTFPSVWYPCFYMRCGTSERQWSSFEDV